MTNRQENSAEAVGITVRRLTRATCTLIALALSGLAPAYSRSAATPALQQEPTARQQPVVQAETVDSLRSRITSLISQPAYDAAQWGIKVISLETGRAIFEQKPNAYFNPASNAKLFTAALALTRLGPDFRIKTSLYSTAPPESGVIRGDLIVYGRGDPTFAARLNDGDYYRALEPLAGLLASAGVKKIEGDLIGDESYFRGPPFGSGWEWDNFQWYYGAEVSALSVNDNSVDLFVKPGDRAGLPCRITTGPVVSNLTIMNRAQTGAKGSECRISVYRPVGENIVYISGCLAVGSDGFTGFVAVHNPANLFVSLFRDVLERRGIAITGKNRTVDWKYREVAPIEPKKLTDLGSVESLPIRDIVRETLKPSQNLYAQLLLLQAGANAVPANGSASTQSSGAGSAAAQPPIEPTTEELGVDALTSLIAESGIKKGDVLLEEGSGLSRRNVVTPNAMVTMLQFMSRHRWAGVFRDALPVAGVDGTLKTRMREAPTAGNVRAKTGTLRFVNALSGYVTSAAGERLAFSIMVNNHYSEERPTSARETIDQIVTLLAGFTGRS